MMGIEVIETPGHCEAVGEDCSTDFSMRSKQVKSECSVDLQPSFERVTNSSQVAFSVLDEHEIKGAFALPRNKLKKQFLRQVQQSLIKVRQTMPLSCIWHEDSDRYDTVQTTAAEHVCQECNKTLTTHICEPSCVDYASEKVQDFKGAQDTEEDQHQKGAQYLEETRVAELVRLPRGQRPKSSWCWMVKREMREKLFVNPCLRKRKNFHGRSSRPRSSPSSQEIATERMVADREPELCLPLLTYSIVDHKTTSLCDEVERSLHEKRMDKTLLQSHKNQEATAAHKGSLGSLVSGISSGKKLGTVQKKSDTGHICDIASGSKQKKIWKAGTTWKESITALFSRIGFREEEKKNLWKKIGCAWPCQKFEIMKGSKDKLPEEKSKKQQRISHVDTQNSETVLKLLSAGSGQVSFHSWKKFRPKTKGKFEQPPGKQLSDCHQSLGIKSLRVSLKMLKTSALGESLLQEWFAKHCKYKHSHGIQQNPEGNDDGRSNDPADLQESNSYWTLISTPRDRNILQPALHGILEAPKTLVQWTFWGVKHVLKWLSLHEGQTTGEEMCRRNVQRSHGNPFQAAVTISLGSWMQHFADKNLEQQKSNASIVHCDMYHVGSARDSLDDQFCPNYPICRKLTAHSISSHNPQETKEEEYALQKTHSQRSTMELCGAAACGQGVEGADDASALSRMRAYEFNCPPTIDLRGSKPYNAATLCWEAGIKEETISRRLFHWETGDSGLRSLVLDDKVGQQVFHGQLHLRKMDKTKPKFVTIKIVRKQFL